MDFMPLSGGNKTDINQLQGLELVVKYWSTRWQNYNKAVNAKVVFIGDVHGDIHQFIAPLVMCNIITLSGKIKTIDSKIHLHIPDYQLATNETTTVIYLGDMVDEWIFSRSIVTMLKNILKERKNVFYIYGNHDVSILGRYFLFKERKLKLRHDIPALWQTLKKELSPYPEIRIINDSILYNNDETEGLNFMYSYIEPLFEGLYEIFTNQLGRLSLCVEINEVPFIVSHSTWTFNAIKQLAETLTRPTSDVSEDLTKYERPGDRLEEQSNTLLSKNEVENHLRNIGEDTKRFILDVRKRFSNSREQTEMKQDYVTLSKICNELFLLLSRRVISKNYVTYSRNTENVFLNHVVGHSIGDEFRDINVNVGQSVYENERKNKLKPFVVNGRKVYYFDFGTSAGYDLEEISRPDFVYVDERDELRVSGLPGFNFIIKYGDEGSSHLMLVLKNKTTRSSEKETVRLR